MTQDKTTRGYPLPHPDNLLTQDVQRLRQSLVAIDRDVTLQSAQIQEQEALLTAQMHRQRLRRFHHFDF